MNQERHSLRYMSNKIHELLNDNQPIELSNIRELDIFETAVYRTLDTRRSTVSEADTLLLGMPLSQRFRPEKFNGTIQPISIIDIKDPVGNYHTAPERYGSDYTKQLLKRTRPTIEKGYAEARLRAFGITADLYSSGRGLVGKVFMEAWYVRLQKPTQYGPIKRFTTEPKVTDGSVEELILASKSVAENIERKALLRINNTIPMN